MFFFICMHKLHESRICYSLFCLPLSLFIVFLYHYYYTFYTIVFCSSFFIDLLVFALYLSAYITGTYKNGHPRVNLKKCSTFTLSFDFKQWFPSMWSVFPGVPAQNMRWESNVWSAAVWREGFRHVGSVASNRLCFLPCKRLMCVGRSDTEECTEFAARALLAFALRRPRYTFSSSYSRTHRLPPS